MYISIAAAARRLLSKSNDVDELNLVENSGSKHELDESNESERNENIDVYVGDGDNMELSQEYVRTSRDNLGYDANDEDDIIVVGDNGVEMMRIENDFENTEQNIRDSLADESSTQSQQTRDVLPEEARISGDLQGIPWLALRMTRDDYRMQRSRRYKSYSNLSASRDCVKNSYSKVRAIDRYFEFAYNSRKIVPTILHFQLRHLLQATSANECLLMNTNCVKQWNRVHNSVTTIMDVSGQSILDPVQISTIHQDRDYLFVGGFHGEVLCQRMSGTDLLHNSKLTDADNSITNSLSSFHSPSGMFGLVCANNNNLVDILDVGTFKRVHRYDFEWPVNHCSASVDGKLLCMVGDTTDGVLFDRASDKRICSLQGHIDFSFASAWHPNSSIVATGNQDMTTRVWDLRNTSKSLKVLPAKLAAIRSLKFSNGGDFLLVGEAADYCHIYDCHNDLSTSQEINFFGEMAGLDISPDGNTVFIGITDNIYGSLLEYRRKPLLWSEQMLF